MLSILVAWCDRPWFTRASDTLVHSETRRVSSRVFFTRNHGVIVLMWSYVNYNINGYSKRKENVMWIIIMLWRGETKNVLFLFPLYIKFSFTVHRKYQVYMWYRGITIINIQNYYTTLHIWPKNCYLGVWIYSNHTYFRFEVLYNSWV